MDSTNNGMDHLISLANFTQLDGAISHAMNNTWFEKQGLVSLAKQRVLVNI